MRSGSKLLYIKTFGCQMNVYDSERMAEALAPAGYSTVDSPDNADLIILNTCHIREKAAEKVYSELGRLTHARSLKGDRGRESLIAVAGCVAQAEGAEIIARAKGVNLVFGPQSYHRLPALVERAARGDRVVDTDFPDEDKFENLPARSVLARTPSAFLTIQEGCDKFCTFCVVPYTRGAEFSRPVSAIVEEAERLAQAGVREITLLGQNVNAWHGEGPGGGWTLARLLGRVSQIEGIERLRYTTSHPRDMSGELISAHGDNPKLMPHLHLPFQAGSDRILAAMNRKHTVRDYLEIVARIRAVRPDIALSTDIIVGFPGETEREFGDTMDLVREIGFSQAYSFRYSVRPGTPAAELSDQLDPGVAIERLHRLQALLQSQQTAFNAASLGRRMPVLFERAGRKPGQLAGRSPYMQAVHAQGPRSLIGQITQVEISALAAYSLEADILTVSPFASSQASPTSSAAAMY